MKTVAPLFCGDLVFLHNRSFPTEPVRAVGAN